MKKIVMLQTAPGADTDKNGQNLGVKYYGEGEVYLLGADLALSFIAQGLAKEYSIPKALGLHPGEKNLGAAPENKMQKTVRKKKINGHKAND